MFTHLLSNNAGGYLALGDAPDSKFQGSFHWLGGRFLRVLEEVRPVEAAEKAELILAGHWGVRKWADGNRDFFRAQKNTLFFRFEGPTRRLVTLDVRESYDGRVWGRNYEISTEGNLIFVGFRKTNDRREPQRNDEYQAVIGIAFDRPDTAIQNAWVRRTYGYDQAREGYGERHVFAVCDTAARRMLVVCGENIDEVRAGLAKERAFLTTTLPKNKDRETPTADLRKSAADALRMLAASAHGRPGLLAGFPWSFQYWTRDEAIAARGLALIGEQKLAKSILLQYLDAIDAEGRIPNRLPAADLGCADGVGWVFLRLRELHRLGDLTAEEKTVVIKRLKTALQRLDATHQRDGLTVNGPLETWMDTVADEDTRAGACIEIQALTLAMRAFALELNEEKDFKNKFIAHKQRVRHGYWQGNCLFDREGDATIRPNLFLAAYAFPDLLSRAQWETCFDHALKALWLPWGGLATIDQRHQLFCAHYTGQDNRSYHRGDSWYFVNCLAAICLRRCNARKYKPYIDLVVQAAERDMRSLGALACASEVSSAAEQTSAGCWNQAWSNALLIELLHELNADE